MRNLNYSGALIYRYFLKTMGHYFVPPMKKLFKTNPDNRFVNLGAGHWYYPRWENIDYYVDDDVFVDYRMDLRKQKKLPLPDGCVGLVFSSHFFEHVSDEEALFVLSECNRILKPGGRIRIGVPDMDKALDAYRNQDGYFFDRGGAKCKGNLERKLVNIFASYRKNGYSGSPLLSKDEIREHLKTLDKHGFAKWCVSKIPPSAEYKAHVNAYDFFKLKDLLLHTGFVDIVKKQYRESNTVMGSALFDHHPIISLYVEARKGAFV